MPTWEMNRQLAKLDELLSPASDEMNRDTRSRLIRLQARLIRARLHEESEEDRQLLQQRLLALDLGPTRWL
jgi:hypothetical protein